MPKWIKLFLGLALLPVAAAEGMALVQVLEASGTAVTTWVPLLAGAAGWLVIFALLPKPMWVYVLGHELTHVLWTWLFRGQVKGIKVSSKGGHVIVSKHNFLTVLAPYFFPLYAAMVVAVYALGNWIWDWRAGIVWFHLALGMTYAFHVTLTAHVLRNEQSDITSQGWIFSVVVIFLANAGLLLGGLPFVTGKPHLTEALRWWWADLTIVWRWLAGAVGWLFSKMLKIHS